MINGRTITLMYKNYKGEIRGRQIEPQGIFFGATEHHKKPQWLIDCCDMETGLHRTFALKDCDFTKK